MENTTPDQSRNVAFIIKYSLLAAILIYGVFAVFYAGQFGDQKEQQERGWEKVSETRKEEDGSNVNRIILYVMIFLSLSTFGAGLFVRQRYQKQLEEFDREEFDASREVGEEEARAFLRNTILTGALFEAIAVFGLLVALLQSNWQMYLPFGAASFLLVLTLTPKWPGDLDHS